MTHALSGIDVCKSDSLQQLMDAGRRSTTIKLAKEIEVFGRSKLVIEERRMCHVANACVYAAKIGATEYLNSAAGGTRESGDDPQQSGLASAVFAQQSIKASSSEVDAQVVEGSEPSEEFADSFEDNCWFRMGTVSATDGRIGQVSVGGLTCRGFRLCFRHRSRLICSRRIFRSTFGLNLLRMKDTIAAIGAFDERL